jgi:hypothetical protein
MPEDRLRHDREVVENLDDIIDAREDGHSDLARDADAFEDDFDIPEDLDVDDALTFPHPKHKKDPNADVELMDTPREDDTDINWAESQSEMLPADYQEHYDDAETTEVYDDEDAAVEDEIGEIGDVTPEDLDEMHVVATPHRGFNPEDDTD